jgi:hypothetical protein
LLSLHTGQESGCGGEEKKNNIERNALSDLTDTSVHKKL